VITIEIFLAFVAGMAFVKIADWFTDEERSLKARLRKLEKAYPDWRNTVCSTAFTRWLELQDASTRALTASTSPKDAIEVLDRFHARASGLGRGHGHG
jgi:hypothetical protein